MAEYLHAIGALSDSLDRYAGRPYYRDLLAGLVHKPADEELELDNVRCVLLYGPEGSGRHALLNGMAGTMAAQGYALYLIDLRSLSAEQQTQAFQEARVCLEKAAVLLVDHIECLADHVELAELIDEAAEADASLVVGIPADSPAQLKGELREMFTAVYVTLPDLNARTAYFEQELAQMDDPMTSHYLAEKTEGLNYYELADLRGAMLLLRKNSMVSRASPTSWMVLAEDALDHLEPKQPAQTGPALDPNLLAALVASLPAGGAQQAQAAQPQKETPGGGPLLNELDELDAIYEKYYT